jgi:hypothetical protein
MMGGDIAFTNWENINIKKGKLYENELGSFFNTHWQQLIKV